MRKTGKTPKQYIDELRLSNAAMLMTEFGYTVTQAGLAVGYSDVMTFSKMYKRHYGKSPRASMKKPSMKSKTMIL
jgi:AraC-like DNA-binding protein